MAKNDHMLAARLYGPRDLRIDEIPAPASPGPGQVLVRIAAVGVCGSDLHTYIDGRIGDIVPKSPMTPGHEFAGIVEQVGDGAVDGEHKPLRPGMLVAIDPAQACGVCHYCEHGNPNFCANLRFCGLWPNDGAMCQYMLVPGRTCFPLPTGTDPAIGAMLETLGVALHATDLARIRVGSRVAVIGAGPIGLCVSQLVRLAGASQVCAGDPLPWRQKLACRLGATALGDEADDAEDMDVALECAHSGAALQRAANLLRPGGTLVAVGIPANDRFELKHSTIRRKGLTIMLVRRMKLTYPRAIQLWQSGRVDLSSQITHRFPLAKAPDALRLNAAYEAGVVKAIIEP